jgi:predicted PurR-regulated permease PerM
MTTPGKGCPIENGRNPSCVEDKEHILSTEMSHPTSFQRKTLWNAATGVAILIIGLLTVGMIWLIGRMFGFLQPVLVPLIVAGIVAYVLDPVVRLLEQRGMSRLWAVVVVFVAMLAGVTLLAAAVVPGIQRGHATLKSVFEADASADGGGQSAPLGAVLARELSELRDNHKDRLIGWLLTEPSDHEPVSDGTVTAAPADDLAGFIHSRAGRFLYDYKEVIFSKARQWVTAGSTRVIGFLGLVLGMIMVPVYLFFFLKDSAAIRDHWHDYMPLRASGFKTGLVETLQEINGYLVSFFRGQVIVALIDGLLVGIALTLFGLPYGFLIGVFMAILGVIPYIGNILCLIPACIIAWLHARGGGAPFDLGPWAYVGSVVAIFLIVQQINSLVTAPKIVGDSVGLHPLTVIFSMLFWSLVLGGFVGALLAVPLSAAVKVLFRRFIWEPQIFGRNVADGAAGA